MALFARDSKEPLRVVIAGKPGLAYYRPQSGRWTVWMDDTSISRANNLNIEIWFNRNLHLFDLAVKSA